MKDFGLVSIIMPSYNSEKYIEEAIESVIRQSYTNWELLITDDLSTDSTINVVKRYLGDSRIKLFLLPFNQGAAAARNNSILNSKGDYIAFLDSDDTWHSFKLEKQLCFMIEQNISFSFSSYDIVFQNGQSTGRVIPVPQKICYNQYLKNTIIGCLTVIIDRKTVGDFLMPNIRSSHDMALWLLIMKKGFCAFGLNEVLATYRLVSTSNTSKKWKAAKDVWSVYRDFENLSLFYSIICFFSYSYNAIKKRL